MLRNAIQTQDPQEREQQPPVTKKTTQAKDGVAKSSRLPAYHVTKPKNASSRTSGSKVSRKQAGNSREEDPEDDDADFLAWVRKHEPSA
jgi:carboxypeptidase C (cathepsin A)